jgi:hypothetical protein
MPVDFRFPLYALADIQTTKTVYRGEKGDRRLLLFTTAENASRYRSKLELAASVVKLREPKDLRILLSMQSQTPAFSIEIDPPEDS